MGLVKQNIHVVNLTNEAENMSDIIQKIMPIKCQIF